MKELIFNIEDIFNNHNQNGCLTQYESSYYPRTSLRSDT